MTAAGTRLVTLLENETASEASVPPSEGIAGFCEVPVGIVELIRVDVEAIGLLTPL